VKPANPHTTTASWSSQDASLRSFGLGSTGKGILIGMLSAFGSAALVAIILAIVYFFRYTNRGRIFLDRIGRPGEYDDEQAFLQEEEQALQEMDDFQRTEYLRAKGRSREADNNALSLSSSSCRTRRVDTALQRSCKQTLPSLFRQTYPCLSS